MTARGVPLLLHLPELTDDEAWKIHELVTALMEAIWDRYGDQLADAVRGDADPPFDPLDPLDDDELW